MFISNAQRHAADIYRFTLLITNASVSRLIILRVTFSGSWATNFPGFQIVYDCKTLPGPSQTVDHATRDDESHRNKTTALL